MPGNEVHPREAIWLPATDNRVSAGAAVGTPSVLDAAMAHRDSDPGLWSAGTLVV
jgi:hypothetical protein